MFLARHHIIILEPNYHGLYDLARQTLKAKLGKKAKIMEHGGWRLAKKAKRTPALQKMNIMN